MTKNMGYDCTLHVIDEAMIRDRFVPRLLDTSGQPTSFDNRTDASELWAAVRTSLVEGEPQEAANVLCQLAIAFCAADLPYHAERGFCLALWPELEQPAKVPNRFTRDPASLFDEVIAKYPRLGNAFPNGIQSNYSAGLFIPADKVPPLLTWVEKQVKRYPKPDHRLFRGLIMVLREAAVRGLAYWEATELPVPFRTMQPPLEDRRPGLEEFRLPHDAWKFLHRRGDLLVVGQHNQTMLVNVGTWPPKVNVLPELALGVDSSREGQWLFLCLDRETGQKHVQVQANPLAPPLRVITMKGSGWDGTTIEGAVFVGERVFIERGRVPWSPMVEIEGGLHELIPPPHLKELRYGSRPYMFLNVARLNDGSDVLLWGNEGFEVPAEEMVRTFEFGGERALEWSYVTSGSDGFTMVADYRRLQLIRRGKPPEIVCSAIKNPRFLTRGPNNSAIIMEAFHVNGELGKIWFPNEATFLRLDAQLFEDEDPEKIQSLHYCERTRRLLAHTPNRIWAVRIDPVLQLSRYDATTGRKRR